MSDVKPQYIANLIVEQGNNVDYERLGNVVARIYQNNIPNQSIEQSFDYAEVNVGYIAEELFEKKLSNSEEGIISNFAIIEDGNTFYIKFDERPELLFLRKLQRDSPQNFEIFCKDILEKLGADANVTGNSWDGGIDFLGFDLDLKGLTYKSTIGSKIHVIGQAKRYKDGRHITEKDLREFIGSATKRIHELKQSRSDSFGIFQPIILAYWITSDFHTNARKFAKEMGLWYLNGIAISQLALSLGMSI